MRLMNSNSIAAVLSRFTRSAVGQSEPSGGTQFFQQARDERMTVATVSAKALVLVVRLLFVRRTRPIWSGRTSGPCVS
jgi:hypothetical protein